MTWYDDDRRPQPISEVMDQYIDDLLEQADVDRKGEP